MTALTINKKKMSKKSIYCIAQNMDKMIQYIKN